MPEFTVFHLVFWSTVAVFASRQMTDTIHTGSIFADLRAWAENSNYRFTHVILCPFCLCHWTSWFSLICVFCVSFLPESWPTAAFVFGYLLRLFASGLAATYLALTLSKFVGQEPKTETEEEMTKQTETAV